MLRSSERTTAPVTPTCLPVPVEAPVISSEGGALQGGSARCISGTLYSKAAGLMGPVSLS